MGHPAANASINAQPFLIVSRAHEPPLCRKVYVYSLDNLAQGQIIRSPRNTGKGHINLPAEGLRCAQEEGREAACGRSIPSPCQPDESAAGRGSVLDFS